jgi:spoIIIJ-associated protein
MTSNDSIEITAATIDQAINQALAQLGADQDDVTIEVLSTPRAGVLGLGARQARVRVTRRAPERASSGVTSPPPAPALVRQQPPAAPTPPKPSESGAKATPGRAAAESISTPAAGMASENEAEEYGEEIPAPSREAAAPRASAETAALAEEATALLAGILDLMGEKADIETVGGNTAENLELNIKGDGSGLLIGRHGQTLDALEYVVNRILARKIKDSAPVSVDTESYRARRRRQLHRMALSKGEQAKREHVAVALDPMPPRDRRIIHLALKDDPLVATRSSGEGFLRSIEIVPVEQHRETSGGRGRERRREREPGSGPDREQPPLGQQGGFKHGQKRIV